MAYSALFISQSHGLIEMHFHFFGALAFLLVYRDWRVIVVAAAFDRRPPPRLHGPPGRAARRVWVMNHEHLTLGMVLLHAVFVVFETTVLVDPRPLAGDRDARDRRSCASTTPPSAPSSRCWPRRSSAAT